MATMILIHGAAHGGWCWEEVAPRLRAEGHTVHAPDLPGMGNDRTAFADDIFAQWVDAVAVLVELQSQPVVLVGHSMGGVVISAAAERMPENIALAIYVAAALLADGESMLGANILSQSLLASGAPNDAGSAAKVPSPAVARDLLYNGVAADLADRAIARLVEQPFQPVSAPLRVTSGRFGSVPKAFIETENDRTIVLQKQREMQQRWTCDEVRTLASCHSPFYEMPETLSNAINELANKYSQ